VQERGRHLPHGREPRGIDADAIAGSDFSPHGQSTGTTARSIGLLE
jgi:hypothetical protein